MDIVDSKDLLKWKRRRGGGKWHWHRRSRGKRRNVTDAQLRPALLTELKQFDDEMRTQLVLRARS